MELKGPLKNLKIYNSKMERKEKLANTDIPALLARFAIPSILSLFFHSLYNVADRIFIGRGVGPLGLAGVTLCFPVILLIFGLCVLFASGSSSLVSICLGQNKIEKAEKVLGSTIFLISLTGLILSLIGIFHSDKLLNFFDVSKETLPHARAYLRIILTGSPLFLFGFTSTFLIRAEGDPYYATGIIVTGTILNIILDPLFIFVFSWGTAGAALATVFSETVVAIMGMGYILRKKGLLHIRPSFLIPELGLIRKLSYLGLSPALMNFAATVQTVFLNKRLLTFGGDTAVAAVGVVLPIASMINLFTYGMASGMQPIIGFNHAAGKNDRAQQTFYYACKINVLAVSLLVLVIFFQAENIVSLFVTGDRDLLLLSSRALRVFLLMSPFAVINILGTRYFQSIGAASSAIFLGVLRQLVIFMPLLYFLSNAFRLDGIWFSAPVADFLAATATCLMLFFSVKRPHKKYT